MGLDSFNAAAGAYGATKTMQGVRDTNAILEQLLWEQRQANKMLWVTLTDEQRAAYVAMEAAEANAQAQFEATKESAPAKGRFLR